MPGVTTAYQTGNHAGRPANGAGCILYSCTTHSKVYRDDGTSWIDFLVLTSATRASLGLDTTDSPEFAGLNVGHASDTTITRVSAGNLAVEGNALYRAGGTDVPIADGGTGASTKAAGFDALSPMSASGDIIYGGASGTGTRLAKGSDGQVLTLASGLPSWAAAGGGSGISGKLPVATGSATQTSSASTLAVTITAASSGNILIACISGIGTANVSSIASTNTTWTNLHTSTAGTSPKAEIWKGVVSGGSSGTTVTITFSANNSDRAAIVSEWNGITGTLDQSSMRAGQGTNGNWGRHSAPAILPTNANALVVGMAACTNGTVKYSSTPMMVGFEPFLLDTGSIIGYMAGFYAFPGTTPIGLNVTGPTSGNYSTCLVSIT